MGYEGHAMGVVDLERRRELMESAMERLIQAHGVVGGDLVTGGGTGTHAINTWVNRSSRFIRSDGHCLHRAG